MIPLLFWVTAKPVIEEYGNNGGVASLKYTSILFPRVEEVAYNTTGPLASWVLLLIPVPVKDST